MVRVAGFGHHREGKIVQLHLRNAYINYYLINAGGCTGLTNTAGTCKSVTVHRK